MFVLDHAQQLFYKVIKETYMYLFTYYTVVRPTGGDEEKGRKMDFKQCTATQQVRANGAGKYGAERGNQTNGDEEAGVATEGAEF